MMSGADGLGEAAVGGTDFSDPTSLKPAAPTPIPAKQDAGFGDPILLPAASLWQVAVLVLAALDATYQRDASNWVVVSVRRGGQGAGLGGQHASTLHVPL